MTMQTQSERERRIEADRLLRKLVDAAAYYASFESDAERRLDDEFHEVPAEDRLDRALQKARKFLEGE